MHKVLRGQERKKFELRGLAVCCNYLSKKYKKTNKELIENIRNLNLNIDTQLLLRKKKKKPRDHLIRVKNLKKKKKKKYNKSQKHQENKSNKGCKNIWKQTNICVLMQFNWWICLI